MFKFLVLSVIGLCYLEAMDAAMEQDEALKERVEFMKQGASYMQEESEPAASNP